MSKKANQSGKRKKVAAPSQEPAPAGIKKAAPAPRRARQTGTTARASKTAVSASRAATSGSGKAAQSATTPSDEQATTTQDERQSAVRTRDTRLPAPGTVLVKRDRDGRARCECTVEEGGVLYGGTLYRSISGAAAAAAVDLGIKGRVNGFLFWGLIKAGRPIANPGEYLRKIARRYEEQVASLLKQEGSPDVRQEVRRELEAHAAHLTQLLATSASA